MRLIKEALSFLLTNFSLTMLPKLVYHYFNLYIYVLLILSQTQRAMTLDEIREVEAVVDGIVEESTSIFSKEVPLTFAKKIEGIKMCSYEVSVNQHFIVNSETIVFLRCL